jgi:hypothetical protein
MAQAAFATEHCFTNVNSRRSMRYYNRNLEGSGSGSKAFRSVTSTTTKRSSTFSWVVRLKQWRKDKGVRSVIRTHGLTLVRGQMNESNVLRAVSRCKMLFRIRFIQGQTTPMGPRFATNRERRLSNPLQDEETRAPSFIRSGLPRYRLYRGAILVPKLWNCRQSAVEANCHRFPPLPPWC